MTASASISSQNQNPEDGDPNSTPTYGTRSRNRPGAARPNYADDKELDMEIEAAGRIKPIATAAPATATATTTTTKKAASSNSHTAESTPAPLGFAAINSLSINGEPAAPQAPAVASPAPTKKRKQPGSNQGSNGATTSYALGPRSKAQQGSAYVETNMMSFFRCASKLNTKKQLVADDGTVLGANGEQTLPIHVADALTISRPCILHMRTSRRTLLPCPHHGIPPCW
jgi:hypothetical protein